MRIRYYPNGEIGEVRDASAVAETGYADDKGGGQA